MKSSDLILIFYGNDTLYFSGYEQARFLDSLERILSVHDIKPFNQD